MSKLTVLKFVFFIACMVLAFICNSQIVSEGSSYVSITGERILIKYTVEYKEENQGYITTYKILNAKLTPIVTIDINNNINNQEVSFRISDLILKSDSNFIFNYTINSGLFIVDGDDVDLTINNTTIYNVLFSFQDLTHGFVTLHTLNTGIPNRGYFQLDPVSNIKIKDHNTMVNSYLKMVEMQEVRFNQEEREKFLADSFALVLQLRKIEDKRKSYQEFMEMRPSLIVPITDSIEAYLLTESIAWKVKHTSACENFYLT